MTMARSSKAEVRNPLLQLPEVVAMNELPPEAKTALKKALKAASNAMRAKGNDAWRRHKAPMAAYWKGHAVYARHMALAISDNQIEGAKP